MDRLERIARMEGILNAAEAAVEDCTRALDRLTGLRQDLADLEDYYESPEWMHDFEADSAGELPPELRRGVLSEDGIYRLLERREELLGELETFLKEERHD